MFESDTHPPVIVRHYIFLSVRCTRDFGSDDSHTSLRNPLVRQDQKTQGKIHGKRGSGVCVVLSLSLCSSRVRIANLSVYLWTSVELVDCDVKSRCVRSLRLESPMALVCDPTPDEVVDEMRNQHAGRVASLATSERIRCKVRALLLKFSCDVDCILHRVLWTCLEQSRRC